eukprot:TRINITY_DN3472_c0_g2_i4.p1 TRINITY_DN3472_c0_g2~~TRINITY_DN3472_c0_g2_i4.p1  ORF type:complete len:393 (+),score=64.68 TRINITY_DN3472_c0_g2_i4:154-1332(+)
MSCRRVFTWIANLLVWGAIVFVVVAYAADMSYMIRHISIVVLVVCATIYYCETFTCSYCVYFFRKTIAAQSYEDIDKMFKAAPLVTLNVACYHYRTVYSRGISSTGRVVTHLGSEEFRYTSWRDASGEFILGTSKAEHNESVAYVLFDLSLDVQFASDGTAEDYGRAKQSIIERNRFDRFQEYYQQNSIPHFQDSFLIQVTDQPPCCFGLGYFIFFGLLTFNAFYSTYFDCYCHKQEFTIRKVISTRADLNAPDMQSQYAYYDPRMQVANQMVIFVGDQSPQAVGLSQPIAQQYLNTPIVKAETLFVPMPQEIEVMQSPRRMPTSSRSASIPSQGQSAYVQYQGQPLQPVNSSVLSNSIYPSPQHMSQPPNMVPDYQEYAQVQIESSDRSCA